ncbi:MAG: hypothetical protein GC184_09565 [Rhizobiales bacterium]|nr:hypothetical protein [Hyphomicrobiales bacterium]
MGGIRGIFPEAAAIAMMALFLIGVSASCAHAGEVLPSHELGDALEAGGESAPFIYECEEAAALKPPPLTCRGIVSAGLPVLDFKLQGYLKPSSDLRVIESITITQEDKGTPVQTIEPVDSVAPTALAANGFELLDMNFDGYADLRLIRQTTPGANVFYTNYLWSMMADSFVPDPALDELSSPIFDMEAQEIRATNRSSAADYETDFYTYNEDVLVMTHRQHDRYGANGICQRTYFDRIGEELKETGTGPCED